MNNRLQRLTTKKDSQLDSNNIIYPVIIQFVNLLILFIVI
jgi:hypothetical protein